ncbi:MAG: hypothetical protein WC260_01725 [Candidatus Pacearchaeota archaeon]
MTKSIYDIISKDKGIKERNALSSYIIEHDLPLEFISTNVISLNLLFGGRVNGGIPKGKISMISAPSMLGKSFVGLSILKSAQKLGMNTIIIDTERSFSFKLAKGLGIDTSREKLAVLQENSIEDVKSIIMTICDNLTIEERRNTFFLLDSWGTLVTSKTIKDALTGNDVSDMTESKKKNALANILLNTQASFFVINHVYDNTGGFGDPLKIPGGRRIIFNSDSIVLGTSRAKEKNKTTNSVDGHIISAMTYKSRNSKELSKLQFRIKNSGGLDVFYGILDDAIEGGYIQKTTKGRSTAYIRPHIEGDEPMLEKHIYNSAFWSPVFKDTDIKKYLESKYTFENKFDITESEKDMDEVMLDRISDTIEKDVEKDVEKPKTNKKTEKK